MQLGQVDRFADASPYRQIAAQLRTAIQRGDLAPGDQLPSEAKLIEHYGVARMTVRQALAELRQEGMVAAQHGRGVFVTEPDQTPPKHSVSVAGVVVDEAGRVLVIQRRDNDRWEAPGGVLDLGETFQAGVRREILEETGVEVEVGPLGGVYNNIALDVVALVFRCSPTGRAARPTKEARDVRWIMPDEVKTYMVPAFAVRVFDALDGGAAARNHDGIDLLDIADA